MLVEMWLKGADIITSSLWSNTDRWNPNGYGQIDHVVYNLLMDFSAIHIFSDCHPESLNLISINLHTRTQYKMMPFLNESAGNPSAEEL